MKTKRLTLILIFAVLLAGTFLPGLVSPTQAAGTGPSGAAEPAASVQASSDSITGNPALLVVVGLTCVLFGVFTFLPLFGKEDGWPL